MLTSDALDDAERELNALLKPIAKAAPALPRAAENEPARERLIASVDALGWSWDKIARHLKCAKTTIIAAYRGHRYVSAWMLDELERIPELRHLPTTKRVAQLRRVG